jgi:cysteine desulfurase / selenocysteine lyase
MNRSCLTGLLCSLPTICVAADVVIRLPQAPSVLRNVVTYACQGLPPIRVEYITAGYFADDLREAMTPVLAGWKAGEEPLASFYGPDMILSETASRFDLSVAWFNALAERASMRALESLGFERAHQHNLNLAHTMREALLSHSIPFADHGIERGSTIFATAPRSPDASERLKEAGIVAAMRSGRIRLSLHVYNTDAQVEHVGELLRG